MTQKQKKRATLQLLVVYDFIFGLGLSLLSLYPDIEQFFSILGSIVAIVLLMRWFMLDAKEYDYKFSKLMLLMMVAFMILAAPFYFIQTRGRRAGLPILYALMFFCLCLFTAGLGAFAGDWAIRTFITQPPPTA